MRSKVTIDGKEIELLSNAATPYRFKQAFGTDLIRFFTDAATSKEYADDTETVVIAQQMAYVMAKQADGSDLTRISMEDFLVWMEQFDPIPFNNFDTVIQIIEAYTGQQKTTSESKKKADHPKEK